MKTTRKTTLATTLLALLTSGAYATNADIGEAIINTIKPQLIEAVKQEYNTDLAQKADQAAVDSINADLVLTKAKVQEQFDNANLDITKVDEKTKANALKIVDLDNKLNETNEEVAKKASADDLEAVKVDVAAKATKEALAETNREVAQKADQAAVDSINADLVLTKAKVQEQFDNANLDITKVDEKTKANALKIVDLDNKLNETNEEVAKKASTDDLEAIKVDVAAKATKEELAETNKVVETNKDNIQSLTQSMKTLDDDIKKVASSIPTDQNLEPIREDLRQTKAKVQEQFDKANLDITKVDEKTKANALKIVDLDNKLNKTNEEVSKKASTDDLEAVKVDVAAKATKEALAETNKEVAKKADKTEVNNINQSLSTRIDKNVASITNNSVRIDKLDQRVTKLDKKLERGLSQQAALSGLFQPYNVGKVNVTAAVGGYKSRTAIAVGAGYRFNDKVAAKAGVSFSTDGGSGSYNVGVNYEF